MWVAADMVVVSTISVQNVNLYDFFIYYVSYDRI